MKTVTFIKPEERLDEITAYQIGKADIYMGYSKSLII